MTVDSVDRSGGDQSGRKSLAMLLIAVMADLIDDVKLLPHARL